MAIPCKYLVQTEMTTKAGRALWRMAMPYISNTFIDLQSDHNSLQKTAK